MAARALLIADLAESTRAYETLGDRAAREHVARCLAALGEVVRQHEGQLAKELGDGILAHFADSDRALWAALSMGDAAERLGWSLRVGLHWGEVIAEGGDVFGTAVNTVARIAAAAKGGEVLFSKLVRPPPGLPGTLRPLAPVAAKGLSRPLELVALTRPAPLAGTVSCTTEADLSLGSPSLSEPRLELVHEGRTIWVRRPMVLTLGRDPGCGLVVDNDRTSRFHAHICARQETFLLTDQSTNGTYVVCQGRKVRIVRESVLLAGNGELFLGQDPQVRSASSVAFRVC